MGFSRLLEALAEREEQHEQIGQEVQKVEKAGRAPESDNPQIHRLSAPLFTATFPWLIHSYAHHLGQIRPCPSVVAFDTPFLQ